MLHVAFDLLHHQHLVRGLLVGEASFELALPVAVRIEGVAAAPAPLGVEVEQLAGQLLSGAPGARLHGLPARAAQLAQGRVLAPDPDVARDLGQLVRGDEDPVVTLVLQVQVVACDLGDGLGLEAREAGDAPDVSGEKSLHSPAPGRALLGRASASEQPVLGDDGEPEARRDEPLPQAGHREAHRGLGHPGPLPQPRRLDPGQVVGRPLALAPPRPGHGGRVARAHQPFELGLGLAQRARDAPGGLGAELSRLVGGDR